MSCHQAPAAGRLPLWPVRSGSGRRGRALRIFPGAGRSFTHTGTFTPTRRPGLAAAGETWAAPPRGHATDTGRFLREGAERVERSQTLAQSGLPCYWTSGGVPAPFRAELGWRSTSRLWEPAVPARPPHLRALMMEFAGKGGAPCCLNCSNREAGETASRKVPSCSAWRTAARCSALAARCRM